MPILSGDVKRVASQVMSDVEEGGGAPTSVVIQDGASNSLFNDISEFDRAGGRVNLRKVFASIQTDTTDPYLGANVVVADPPDDPRVAVTLLDADLLGLDPVRLPQDGLVPIFRPGDFAVVGHPAWWGRSRSRTARRSIAAGYGCRG